MQTTHTDSSQRFCCKYCAARFKWKSTLGSYIKGNHRCILTANDRLVNWQQHLRRLSDETEFVENEWTFVKVEPVGEEETGLCPCGQTGLKNYFMIRHKRTGNMTRVGSKCM